MRLNSAVALSLALPLSVHAHNSLRSLNPSHRHLAVRNVVVTPELVTSIDSPLPSTITPSENATTVLIPVDPSTVSRIDSALPNPSKSITLYYAEASYTDGAHYKSVIEWDMNWPALVLGDAPQVESFTCGLDGKILTFNDKDAFEEALDWDFPLVLVTEDTSSGCSFEAPDAPQYNPVHLRSIASYDRKSLTINFRGYKSFWALEASYHQLSIGFDPHAERVLNETTSLAKRGVFDPWTYNLLSNMNFNDTSKGALEDSISIYKGKYEKGPFEGELDVACKDCYVQGSMIVTVDTGSSIGNAGLNVLAAVVSLTDQAITEVKNTLSVVGNAAATATTAVLSALGDTAKNIVDSLQTGAAAAIKAGASDIESLYKSATSELSSAVNSAKTEIGSALDSLGEAAHDVADALGDAASTIADGAQSAIDYIGSKIGSLFDGWWRKRAFMTQEERDAAVDEFFRHLGEELESGAFLKHKAEPASLSRRSSSGSDLFLEALAESSEIYKSKGEDAVLRKRGMVRRDGSSGFVGLKGGLNASVDVDVTMAGKLSASFNKTLATYGIPKLQIPDVVVVGPYLKLDGSIEVALEGNVTFTTGASLFWNGIDMKVSTSANQNKQTLPMPTYAIHNSSYNVNEIGLKAGVYIEPKVVVGLNLIAANQELSGGLGLKFGLENNFKIATDNCSDGINWSIDVTGEALALYTIPRALSEALGKDDPEQDYSIYEADPIPLYEKCFSLSSKLCSNGQVFSGNKLKCVDNSTEADAGNSTSTATTTLLPISATSAASTSLSTSRVTTSGRVTTTTRSSSSTSRSTSRSSSSIRTTSVVKPSSTSKASTTTKKPVSSSTKKPSSSSTKRPSSSSTTKKVSTTTRKSTSATRTPVKTTTKPTSKPHTTTRKSTSTKHSTTSTKRVSTTKKPTSTKKPASSTKKPVSSSTKKPSSSTKPHPSTSPARPAHTHKPVKSASLYAGWMIYGDNLTCSPTANIMHCIGECQSRSGCVGIDWGFRDGAWKCCLKRNIKKFNKEGAGMFHNVVLLDGTCGTHANKLNIPAAMRAVCDPLDVV